MSQQQDDQDTQNQLMKLAVEASPNGMIMVDREGVIILVNSSAGKMFGYTREELIGNTIDLLIPQTLRAAHPMMRESYFAEPTSRAMGGGRELYARHKAGHEFPVEIGLNPIQTDDGVLVLAAIVDITERYRAQEMIRLAVEAAPNGMIMTDKQGVITMVNTSAEELFGYSREELVGSDITLLIPERFKSKHPELFRQYFTNPVSRAMGKGRDLYAQRKSGDEIMVEIGLNPISTLQGTMVLASVVDITARKLQEQSLKDTLKEKEVLLSEIHHRVKNNLQVIDSLIGMQLDNTESEQAVEVLRESQNRVKSMAMIHQTLYQSQDFSRVALSPVIQKLVANLITSYAAADYQMDIDIDDLHIPLDASIPLGLIVNELVSNTFKHAYPASFTSDSGRTISISCKTRDDHAVELVVSDDGQGLAKPFEEMKQQSLGLRLVEALTQQLKGTLSVNQCDPTEFKMLFADLKQSQPHN